MSRIHCPHCGTANQDVTANEPCWKCGKRLSDPVDPNAPAPEPQAAPSTYLLERKVPESGHKNQYAPVVSLLLLVAVVALIVVVAMALRR